MKKYLYVVVIIIMFLACILGMYFSHFNNGFSENPNDWSAFGAYFGGVMSPILTFVNMGIFVWLTIKINNKEEERTREANTREEERTKETNQLNKRIHKSLMQQNIIDKLMNQLNLALIGEHDPSIVFNSKYGRYLLPTMNAEGLLKNFIKSKTELFDLNSHTSKLIFYKTGKAIFQYRKSILRYYNAEKEMYEFNTFCVGKMKSIRDLLDRLNSYDSIFFNDGRIKNLKTIINFLYISNEYLSKDNIDKYSKEISEECLSFNDYDLKDNVEIAFDITILCDLLKDFVIIAKKVSVSRPLLESGADAEVYELMKLLSTATSEFTTYIQKNIIENME